MNEDYRRIVDELAAMSGRIAALAGTVPVGTFIGDALVDLADSVRSQVEEMQVALAAIDWSAVTGWAEE